MIGFRYKANGLIDSHCHILPYVDDGAEDFGTATEMLAREYSQGVRTVVMTVHYRYEMFDTPIKKVYLQFDELYGWLNDSYMNDMDIMLCREYYCDDRLLALLDGYGNNQNEIIYDEKKYSPKEEIIPYGKNKCILLEFSSGRMQELEFELYVKKASNAGLTPIIAHVERYPAVQERPTIVCKMRDLGAYIQVNCDSILSRGNSKEKQVAAELIKNRMVDILASDSHDLKMRSPNFKKCYNFLERKYGKKTANELLRDNVGALIYGFENNC